MHFEVTALLVLIWGIVVLAFARTATLLPRPGAYLNVCQRCGYSLEGLAHTAQCPECGLQNAGWNANTRPVEHISFQRWTLGVASVLGIVGTTVWPVLCWGVWLLITRKEQLFAHEAWRFDLSTPLVLAGIPTSVALIRGYLMCGMPSALVKRSLITDCIMICAIDAFILMMNVIDGVDTFVETTRWMGFGIVVLVVLLWLIGLILVCQCVCWTALKVRSAFTSTL